MSRHYPERFGWKHGWLRQRLPARNVDFSVVSRSNAQIHGAIFETIGFEELWVPALRQDGELREGAAVMELTELVDLSS
jgi:hypothetical protein